MVNSNKNNNLDGENLNNGVAERGITADDMKKYKNALDNTKNYISGVNEWSSSSHQFSTEPTRPK